MHERECGGSDCLQQEKGEDIVEERQKQGIKVQDFVNVGRSGGEPWERAVSLRCFRLTDSIRMDSKPNDHDTRVVRAEVLQCVLQKFLGGRLRILDVLDQVDGVLVIDNVPKLRKQNRSAPEFC